MLNSGHKFQGDIQKLDDGGCWVTLKTGSIKFEKDEIKRIIIFSNRDTVKEGFVYSLRITPGTAYAKQRETITPYENTIQQAAKKYQLDSALIKAVIKAESNFDPFDKSCKGACGLMQLMPGTAKILGVKSIYSPEENINAGSRYLKDMLYTFGGDVEHALAAYNAGPIAVKRYKAVPPYKETKNYVDRVYRYYRNYKHKASKVTTYTDKDGKINFYNK